MAKSDRDLRTYLQDRYPKVAARTPDGVMKVAQPVFGGWRAIGYGRYLIAIILMIAVPILMKPEIIPAFEDVESPIPYLNGSFGVSVLVDTGIYILLALGLSIVVGMAGLLDLGYVAFFMLGAYTTAMMTDSGGAEQFHFVIWPNIASLPFAVLVCVLAGVALGTPTLRLRGDYLAIVTLGFHEIVRQTANNLPQTNGSRGIPGIERPELGPIEFSVLTTETYWFYLLIPAIILAVIMIRHLEDSRIGRYWTAIREDEVAAAAMGVPVVRMKVLAFAIGASTSGVAGWIYAGYLTFISPANFPLLASILILAAVVIGGLGSISGAVLGAVLVQGLPQVVREASGGETIFGFDPETGRIAVFGFLLIVVMIFRPGGLLAPKRRRVELSEASAAEGVIVDESAQPSKDEAEFAASMHEHAQQDERRS
ncbi:MAG: branched-chain amino acid ABC transporter permease [Chloroflexota bacterium]|nr:branched-chain amino acid ABC transporter permease [Chloroflexota bacterium]